MKKRELIEALKPLGDYTEILIANGIPCEQIEYIDDRFIDPLIRKKQVRLYGHHVYRPGEYNPKLFPPKILGVDPLRSNGRRACSIGSPAAPGPMSDGRQF